MLLAAKQSVITPFATTGEKLNARGERTGKVSHLKPDARPKSDHQTNSIQGANSTPSNQIEEVEFKMAVSA